MAQEYQRVVTGSKSETGTGAVWFAYSRAERRLPATTSTSGTSTSGRPRDLVFDVIAQPYVGRATRAQQEKIQVLERGDDMVLVAHRTPIGCGLVTETVETVAFTRPDTIDFRLVRRPVPVRERFTLTGDGDHIRLEYTGEMGTDGWALDISWAAVVARPWEATVADSLATVKSEAARRHALQCKTPSGGGPGPTAEDPGQPDIGGPTVPTRSSRGRL